MPQGCDTVLRARRPLRRAAHHRWNQSGRTQRMEGSTEGLAVDTEFAHVTRLKRESEQPLPELEKEIADEVERSKPRISALLQDVAD